MTTYAIFGEWTGPQRPAGDYQRAVHCHIVQARTKEARRYIEGVQASRSIKFTDGTRLIVLVRDITGLRGADRPKERPAYRNLINDCVRHGVDRVADLPGVQQ